MEEYCGFAGLAGEKDAEGRDLGEICCPTRRVLDEMTTEAIRARHLVCARRLATKNREQEKQRALQAARDIQEQTSRRQLGGDPFLPGQICPEWCPVCDCLYGRCEGPK